LSRQLADFLTCPVYDKTELYDEQQGKGIVAIVNGHEVVIGSAVLVGLNELSQHQGTRVYIRIDQTLLGFVRFKNHYRGGMEASIASLSENYGLAVLSGDNDQERHYLHGVFGQQTTIRFNQSPADKLEAIQEMKQQKAGLLMMIGDGLNDAAALRQADIGMAVSEKSGQFTPASDAIIDADQLSKLYQLLRFTRQTRIIIFSNLSLSLIYNITGLSFALSGLLTPVVSAILMPVSSITVVLNATLMNRYFAHKNKLR
jgi:Cu+-exporting ATPase